MCVHVTRISESGQVTLNQAQITIHTEDGRVFYDMTGADNPCFGCGACCRFYRVSFYHGELDSQPGGYVPTELCASITPFRACMKGTESGGVCIALRADASCGIYGQRPSVCREFPALMPDGSLNPECVRLRKMFGIGQPG